MKLLEGRRSTGGSSRRRTPPAFQATTFGGIASRSGKELSPGIGSLLARISRPDEPGIPRPEVEGQLTAPVCTLMTGMR